jgi:predicted RNA-binding protein (virulence factor B family)
MMEEEQEQEKRQARVKLIEGGATLGQYNVLKVLRGTSVGYYLGDAVENDILLPHKYVPEDIAVDEEIEVFVYRDSGGRIVATTIEPYCIAGEFDFLECNQLTQYGAFVEIGLEKDILVPFKQQVQEMYEGNFYVTYVYLDQVSQRLVGSTRLNKFFSETVDDVEKFDKVKLMIYNKTDIGLAVVVNNKYRGLLYDNEVYEDLEIGDKIYGYVKKVREDGRLDVTLQQPGYANVDIQAQKILDKLKENDNFLALTDKTNAEIVKEVLAMSKKTFKKSIGLLYRQRIINIEDDGIRLI